MSLGIRGIEGSGEVKSDLRREGYSPEVAIKACVKAFFDEMRFEANSSLGGVAMVSRIYIVLLLWVLNMLSECLES